MFSERGPDSIGGPSPLVVEAALADARPPLLVAGAGRVDAVQHGADGPHAQGRVSDRVHVDVGLDLAVRDAAGRNRAAFVGLLFDGLRGGRADEPGG